MTTDEIKPHLCTYDRRNPNNVLQYMEDDQAKEHEALAQTKRESGMPCTCDNCFYGRTPMAEELLRIHTVVHDDQDLAVEIIARFIGNSRGIPIAKLGFVDGVNWIRRLIDQVPKGATAPDHLQTKSENMNWIALPHQVNHGATTCIQEGSHVIAEVFDKKHAPVIAAAPELLQLAKQILLARDAGENIPGDIIAGAEAAIKKAEPWC